MDDIWKKERDGCTEILTVDGKPLEFFLHNFDKFTKHIYTTEIERNGARCTKHPAENTISIILRKSEVDPTLVYDVYHADFVNDCIRQQEVLDKENYRIPRVAELEPQVTSQSDIQQKSPDLLSSSKQEEDTYEQSLNDSTDSELEVIFKEKSIINTAPEIAEESSGMCSDDDIFAVSPDEEKNFVTSIPEDNPKKSSSQSNSLKYTNSARKSSPQTHERITISEHTNSESNGSPTRFQGKPEKVSGGIRVAKFARLDVAAGSNALEKKSSETSAQNVKSSCTRSEARNIRKISLGSSDDNSVWISSRLKNAHPRSENSRSFELVEKSNPQQTKSTLHDLKLKLIPKANTQVPTREPRILFGKVVHERPLPSSSSDEEFNSPEQKQPQIHRHRTSVKKRCKFEKSLSPEDSNYHRPKPSTSRKSSSDSIVIISSDEKDGKVEDAKDLCREKNIRLVKLENPPINDDVLAKDDPPPKNHRKEIQNPRDDSKTPNARCWLDDNGLKFSTDFDRDTPNPKTECKELIRKKMRLWEENEMIRFLYKTNNFNRSGSINVWNEMSRQGFLPHRPAVSLLQNFKRMIKPYPERYIPDEKLRKLVFNYNKPKKKTPSRSITFHL